MARGSNSSSGCRVCIMKSFIWAGVRSVMGELLAVCQLDGGFIGGDKDGLEGHDVLHEEQFGLQ